MKRFLEFNTTHPGWVPRIRSVVQTVCQEHEIGHKSAAPGNAGHFTGNFEAAEAKKIFVLFDTDSSGILEPAEIVGFIKLMKGMDKVDPMKIVETWDADKDGKVRRDSCCCASVDLCNWLG